MLKRIFFLSLLGTALLATLTVFAAPGIVKATLAHAAPSLDIQDDGTTNVQDDGTGDKGDKAPVPLAVTLSSPSSSFSQDIYVTVCVTRPDNKSTKGTDVSYYINYAQSGGLAEGTVTIGNDKDDRYKAQDRKHCALIGVSYLGPDKVTIHASVGDAVATPLTLQAVSNQQSAEPSSGSDINLAAPPNQDSSTYLG